MIILVAGAAGFLGSHVAERLLQDGHHVVGLDNGATGDIATLIRLRQSYPRFTHIAESVENPAWTRHEFVKLPFPFDAVMHFASPSSPVFVRSRPINFIHANVIGTELLLEFARHHKARFFFASTALRQVDPTDPHALAAEAKHLGEALTMAFSRGGVDTRIARIHETYGPEMRLGEGREIPAFIEAVLTKNPMRIAGSASAIRSVCYVDDMVNGILAVMNAPSSLPYVLGNPLSTTVGEICDTLTALLPMWDARRTVQEDLPTIQGEIPALDPTLEWQPTTTLAVGLQRTINFFRPQLVKTLPLVLGQTLTTPNLVDLTNYPNLN